MDKKILLALAGVSLLTACGSTKLMSDKAPPDEPQVIDGPGLVLPPDFDLRPPREATDYESVLRQQKNAEAQGLITGVSGSMAGVRGTGALPADGQWVLKKGKCISQTVTSHK